jgi:hypothetical protein
MGTTLRRGDCGGRRMLLTIVGILVLLWLIGLVTNVVGGLIHAVLVIALIVLAVNFLQGRRAT